MEELAGGSGAWLALVTLVLNSVCARPERACLCSASDFLLTINSVPVERRHPLLREPLFAALGARCLAHAALPERWRGWADAGASGAADDEEDADEVQRFREQTLGDLLECCYAQLRTPWLAQALGGPLGLSGGGGGGGGGAARWPPVEAALFALRTVVLPLRECALGERAADALGPGGAEERAAANSLLASLFGRLACEDAAAVATFASHPMVAESACRLIGAYAAWLGRSPAGRPHVCGVTAYLLRALSLPAALPHAAEALRSVCARCGDALCEPRVFAQLVATAHACLPEPPPAPPPDTDAPPDHRAAVVEGLARLVARMAPPDAPAAALALTLPMLQRASARLTQGDASPVAAHALSCDLRLLASALRFLECGGEGGACAAGRGSPALSVLRAAWPLLGALGESAAWRASPPVVGALCEVYSRAFTAARADAQPLLPPALAVLLAAYEAHGHAGCLDALATALEVFSPPVGAAGSPDGAAVGAALAEALLRAADATQRALAQRTASPDALRALLELAQRAALFAPQALLAAATLEPLLCVATHALGLSERDPCAAAAKLLHALLCPARQMAAWGSTWRRARPALDAALARHGQPLSCALMRAAAHTAPRGSVASLGAVEHALLACYGGAAQGWLTQAVLEGGALAGAAGGPAAVGDQEKRLFLQLCTQPQPLSPQRFEALFADWAKICRREESPEALLAYQM